MMIEKTKIALSAKELEMVCNTDWILTKQSIILKVYQLFGDFSDSIQQQISSNLTENICSKSPKISRGENYQNLPYVMLDYPRCFSKNETVAVRTFFWWGNFCSINLHLSGKSKAVVMPKLIEQFSFFQQHDFSICVNNTPWEHHFEPDNFVPVKTISFEHFKNVLEREPFVKIAKKIPLQEWEKISLFIRQSFSELLQFIPIMHPGDEKDLLPDTPTIDFGL
jgi:hypothetical protein